MEALKWKPRMETSEMQLALGLWNLDTAQWNNGTVTMEALKWKPRSGPRRPLKCKAGTGTMEP